jgi:RNA polymerase sigma factor (sigma-70 family)
VLSFFRKKNYSDSSDDELLALFRDKNDQEALGILYEKHLEMVYGVCFKYLNEKEKAQDAVLDIFEILTEKAKNHSIQKFDGWLFMLAKNHCLMQLRKAQKNQTISLEDRPLEESEEVQTEHDAEREENLQSLESCIEKLPNDQKIVITMFYLEEKSYKEIADFLQTDTEKIRSFIQNGRRNLKICMGK